MRDQPQDLEFDVARTAAAGRVDAALQSLLPDPADAQGSPGEARLAEAMRYAALGPGKRLRAFLVMESANLFGVDEAAAARVAAAIECVHAYSLVHDDLPCMDDDDLRRGRATVHRAYDEATAVLTGDGLLTLAFEILAARETHPSPFVRVELVRRLASAGGAHGMVGGQMLDLDGETRALNAAAVTRLQHLKTGALIAFSCEAGPVMAQAGREAEHAMRAYAHDLGLAFQIHDDILDVEGDAGDLGKSTGKDAAAGKATFITALGLEGARDRARMLADQAGAHLAQYGPRAELLRAAARFAISRFS